jgi:hypothetical protein
VLVCEGGRTVRIHCDAGSNGGSVLAEDADTVLSGWVGAESVGWDCRTSEVGVSVLGRITEPDVGPIVEGGKNRALIQGSCPGGGGSVIPGEWGDSVVITELEPNERIAGTFADGAGYLRGSFDFECDEVYSWRSGWRPVMGLCQAGLRGRSA